MDRGAVCVVDSVFVSVAILDCTVLQ